MCTVSFTPPLMSLWGLAASQWAAHALSGRYRGRGWGSGWNSAHRPFHWHRRVEYWYLKEASARIRIRFKSCFVSLKTAAKHRISFQLTCFSWHIVRVKSVTNCSSYWLTLTPAISVRHFSVTLRNIGTFKNWKQTNNSKLIWQPVHT